MIPILNWIIAPLYTRGEIITTKEGLTFDQHKPLVNGVEAQAVVDGAGAGVVVEEAQGFAFCEEVAAEAGEAPAHQALGAHVLAGRDAHDHGGGGVFGGSLGDGQEAAGGIFYEIDAGGAGFYIFTDPLLSGGDGVAEFINVFDEVEDTGGVVWCGNFDGWGWIFRAEMGGFGQFTEVGDLFDIGRFRAVQGFGGFG